MTETELEYAWFFRTEFPSVLRSVFLILRDRSRAEDVAQDAFVQLYAHWRKVSRYERPEAWVRRVAIRMAVREQKRSRLRPILERNAAAVAPPGSDLDLTDALSELSPTQRAVVVLYYYEDRPTSEIVEILGMSQSTVRVHLSRARRHLAELLREEVGDDVG